MAAGRTSAAWRGRGASVGDPGRILPGSWPDPSGKLAGSFGDGSRTIRGRFEGLRAAKGPSAQAGGLGAGAEPCAGRARPEGALADGPGRSVPREREPVSLHGFMAKPFLGVHPNLARQSPVLSQVQAHPNRFRPPRVNCSFRSDHREDRCTARGRPSPSFPGVIPCGAPRSSPSGAAARDRWHPAAGVARPVPQRGAKSKASRRRRPTRHASRRPPAQSQRHQKN